MLIVVKPPARIPATERRRVCPNSFVDGSDVLFGGYLEELRTSNDERSHKGQ